ncbi:MAG: SPOR domain-containing protein [Saprospiraceae bacterium]
MTNRYRTVFLMSAVMVGFFAVGHILYRAMEQMQARNDQRHAFSEEKALQSEPQFTFSDTTSSLYRAVFSNDPAHRVGEGPFLVLAGSFQTEGRAEKHLARLKKLGYRQAEVLVFSGRRTIYAVGIGAYTNVADARKKVSQMDKAHRLDAYVHKIRSRS